MSAIPSAASTSGRFPCTGPLTKTFDSGTGNEFGESCKTKRSGPHPVAFLCRLSGQARVLYQ